jgi:HK97 family phage major capsid protein
MAEDYKEMIALMTKMGKSVEGLDGNLNNMSARIAKVEEAQSNLKGIIDRLGALEKQANEAGARGHRLQPVGIDLHERLKPENDFSFAKAAFAIAQRDKSLAPTEWRLMKEAARRREIYKAGGDPGVLQTRDMATDIDSGAGFIVPLEYVAELIELLRARVVVEALGATKMTGLTGGPVLIPRQNSASTAYWVAENNVITHSQQTVGQVEMRPREAGALTVLSNRLLRMSSPSAEAMVRNDLTLQLARLADLAALTGLGNLQPLGVLNTPGISTTSISTQPTVDNLYTLISKLEQANADLGDMGWVFHPILWNWLRQLKDGNGRYILSMDAMARNVTTQARPAVKGTLLGYPFATTTQLSTALGTNSNQTPCIFGNWNDLIWGEWFGLELQASDVTSQAFEKNQTYIRAILEMDLVVRHGPSFAADSTFLYQ